MINSVKRWSQKNKELGFASHSLVVKMEVRHRSSPAKRSYGVKAPDTT